MFQTEKFRLIHFKVSSEFCKGIVPAAALHQLPKIFLSKKVLITRSRWILCSVWGNNKSLGTKKKDEKWEDDRIIFIHFGPRHIWDLCSYNISSQTLSCTNCPEFYMQVLKPSAQHFFSSLICRTVIYKFTAQTADGFELCVWDGLLSHSK